MINRSPRSSMKTLLLSSRALIAVTLAAATSLHAQNSGNH